MSRVRKTIFFCLALFLLSVLLSHMVRYAKTSSFDFDEVFILRLADGPWWQILTSHRFDPGTPPLSLMLVSFWTHAFGNRESILRLLPMLWYGLSFLVITALISRIMRLIPAVFSILLFGGNGILWYFGSYLKPYSLLLMSSMATLCIFVYIAEKNTVPKLLFALGVALCTIGLYAHYSFLLFLLVLVSSGWIVFRDKPANLRPVLVMIGISLLLFTPWIVLFLKQQLFPDAAGNRYFFHQLLEGWIGFAGWLGVLTNGVSSAWGSLHQQNILGADLVLLFTLVLIQAGRKTENPSKRIIFMMTILTGILIFFTPAHALFTEARYFIFYIPLVFLSAGILADRNLPPYGTAVLCILALSAFPATGWFTMPQRADWKGLTARVRPGQSSVILFDPCHLGFVFTYYFRGNLPMRCFIKNPEGFPLPMWDKEEKQTLYIIKNADDFGFDRQHYALLLRTYAAEEDSFGSVSLIVLTKL